MSEPITPLDRRTFLQGAGTLAAASLSAAPSLASAQESAAGDAELRVALIGCGGRGTGACRQALNTGNNRLVAMADAFPDRLEESLSNISAAHPDAVDVPNERKFVGFDAFKKAIDEDVDVVILTTPPGLPPGALRLRGLQGQARLHGEARRRRRPGDPDGHGGGGRRQGEEAQGRRRAPAAPRAQVPGDDPRHRGRRHRRAGGSCASTGTAAASGCARAEAQ